MVSKTYKASKTRSKRPGWSVTFSHPRRSDARGKFGVKGEARPWHTRRC